MVKIVIQLIRRSSFKIFTFQLEVSNFWMLLYLKYNYQIVINNMKTNGIFKIVCKSFNLKCFLKYKNSIFLKWFKKYNV